MRALTFIADAVIVMIVIDHQPHSSGSCRGSSQGCSPVILFLILISFC